MNDDIFVTIYQVYNYKKKIPNLFLRIIYTHTTMKLHRDVYDDDLMKVETLLSYTHIC